MPATPERLSLREARAVALAAQGFYDSKPKRVDRRHFERVMDRVGLVQLDSVNVCIRAHYMPFFARLGGFDCDRLDDWLNTPGRHFEYWCHEAAVVPVDRYPLWRWKMAQPLTWKRALAVKRDHPQLERELLRQIRRHGGMTASEVDAPKERSGAWWGYGPAKIALETLFHEGKLSALRGSNFQRRYYLPKELVPSEIRRKKVSESRAHDQLLVDAVQRLGVATADDAADYYRLHRPRARSILERAARRGDVVPCEVEGWKGATYLDPEARRPRKLKGTALLCPFDPLVWYRPRLERLFDFHYRIEIYVPKHQRKFGYYVLPFMLDGEIVGRVDLKADRKRSALVVQAAFVEEAADAVRVRKGLNEELERMAAWLGLGSISVRRRGNLRL